MRLRLAAAAIFAFLQATACVHGETLRIAGGQLPGAKGNPYATSPNIALDLYSALFDTLTHVTSAGALIPWVAESWREGADGAWQFRIKPDLRFSNGEPLDAEAVTAAITYLKSNEGQREPAATGVIAVKTAHALDSRTVEIVPVMRDPFLPQRLSSLWIVPPQDWKTKGRDDFAAHPIGSGPYQVQSWVTERVSMTAAPTSWRKAPTDELERLVIIDPAGRNAALFTGRVDIAIASIAPETVATVEAMGGSTYIDQLPAVIAIAFNTVRDAQFRDVRIRQALNYAVNKDLIAKILLDDKSRPAGQVGRSGFFGYNAAIKPYPYDPAKARQLLAEAGHAEGFSFVMEFASGAALWDSIFQQVANDLKAVGVVMEIRMASSESIARSVQTGEWRGSAWGTGYFSAAFDALEPMLQHSCLWHAPWFCDDDITTAIKTARAATDLDVRRLATERVMTLTQERAQGLFIYESIGFIGLGPRVKQFQSDFGFIRYETLNLAALKK